jgi:uncharacterized protein YjbI with pentapeptide repeats
MANPKHLVLVKQGVATWNEWRQKNPALLPDLSEAYLSEPHGTWAEFDSWDLSGADLRLTYLCGADLSGANLGGLDLSKANLSETDLSETDLSKVTSARQTSGGRISAARTSPRCEI